MKRSLLLRGNRGAWCVISSTRHAAKIDYTFKGMIKTHAHTQATGVNSHCKGSSNSTGSHGVPAGEAESIYFWNLQMEEQKHLENVRER